MKSEKLPNTSRELGKYQIKRELGRGGMGVVYLAVDTTLDRDVAVKMVRPALALEPRSIERFKQEARSVAALEHPNIVHINSFGEIDSSLLIEMPYLSGGSLRQRAQNGLALSGLARALVDILRALDRCHRSGFVHRDVKPSNILFDADLVAKLSDFGAAALLAEEWEEGSRSEGTISFVGTPQYAPPEAWYDSTPTSSWDLYALGVVARELVTGEPLYRSSTPLMHLRKLVEVELGPVRETAPGISEEFGALIDDLCAKDATRRPATAADAVARLLDTPEHKAAGDLESPTGSTLVRWPRSSNRTGPHDWRRSGPVVRRAIKSTVLATLLAAGVGAGYLLHNGEPAQDTPHPSRDFDVPLQPLTQQQAFAHAIPTAELLPALARQSSSVVTRLYDVRTSQHPGKTAQLLVRNTYEGDPAMAMGLLNDYFVFIALTPESPEQLSVGGFYMTYGDEEGRNLQYGNLSGKATWSGELDEVLWLELNYKDQIDFYDWSETAVCSPAPANVTDTAMALAWEQHPKAMPAFWREVWFRYGLELQYALDFLPALHGTLGKAPRAGLPLTLDGVLDEAPWKGAMDTGIAGYPLESNARIAALQDSDGLGLGFDLGASAIEQDRLVLTLMPFYRVPVDTSPYLHIEIGKESASARWVEGGQNIPVTLDWQVAMDESGQRIELHVGNNAVRRSNAVQPGEVYRLNAQLVDVKSGVPILVWGYPDLDAVRHGAVIWFTG